MVMLGANAAMSGGDHRSKATKFKILAADIKRLDSVFAETIKANLLSSTGRLLLFIASCEAVSVKDAMRASGLSNRAFFEAYGRLRDSAFIRVEPVPRDRRQKMLMLGEAFHKMLDGQ
jgi:DNA-binding MarR family transcriptional regulator